MSKSVEITDLEDSFKVSEVAKMCQVTTTTIVRWGKQGHFRVIQPPTGKPLRVPKVDFYDFFEKYSFLPTEKEGEHEEEKGTEVGPEV